MAGPNDAVHPDDAVRPDDAVPPDDVPVGPPPTPVALRRARRALVAVFLVQGLLFITMTTHLPMIQERFGLDSAALSLVLLGMVLCAGLGSLAAERAVVRIDSAAALRAGLALIGLGAVGIGLSPTFGLLCLCLVVYGVGLGAVDATMNMQGVTLEHRAGRTLLPGLHACWTLGGIVATVAALTFGAAEMALSVAPFGVLAVVLTAVPGLIGGRQDTPVGAEPAIPRAVWRRIIRIGIVLVLFYLVDTAASTWGPTYLHDLFSVGVGSVAIATLPYLCAALLARAAGDRAAERFGVVRLLRAAAVTSAVALALVVTAPNAVVAVVGFALLGFGAGVIAPLSFSAAGSIAGEPTGATRTDRRRVDALIARFNQFNYLGALLGSVLTGLVGSDSLRIGFALPLVLILAIWPLARAFATEPEPRG